MDQTKLKPGAIYWVRPAPHFTGHTHVVEIARFEGYTWPAGQILSKPWQFIGCDECFLREDYIAHAECNPPPVVVD